MGEGIELSFVLSSVYVFHLCAFSIFSKFRLNFCFTGSDASIELKGAYLLQWGVA